MSTSEKKNGRFSWPARGRSFKYAFDGLKTLWTEEHNARIHLFAAIFAIAAGFYFSISTSEWIIMVLCIGLVFTVEAINSSIENLADHQTTAIDPRIKKAKDLAAAAVLMMAVVALIVGGIIFIPHLISLDK